MNKITLKQADSLIPHLFNAGVVPFLHSSPAIGKSSLAKSIAKRNNLKVIDLRLTELDSSDLNGLPYFKDGKSTFLPFDTFPLQDTPVPEGYNGWLLLMDELNSAAPSVQSASYKLILDRMVGQHKLHDDVYIIACGNLDTDNAITYPLSSALISRFAHFYIEVNDKEWREWASDAGLDIRVVSFIGFRPSLLYTFNPDSTEPYGSPRTWEMVSRTISLMPELNKTHMPLIASMVGDGVATEFMQFIALADQLPKFEDIIAKPDSIKVPTELGMQWAVLGMMTGNVEKDNINEIITFLKRLPREMQVVAIREIMHRKPALSFALSSWVQEIANEVHL